MLGREHQLPARRRGRGAAAAAALLAVASAALAGSAIPRSQDIPWNRMAVDRVTTSDGLRLLGSVIGRHGDGAVELVVERQWLADHHAAFHATWLEGRAERIRQALDRLLSRIDQWLVDRADDRPLVAFLEDQRKRVASERQGIDAAPLPRFVLVELAADQVQSVVMQPAGRRAVLHAAWSANLRDASTRSSSALVRELRERGVDPNQPVDLSAELPMADDDERQWAARVALVEYRLRKPLELQGTGDFVMAAGTGAPVDVNALVGSVLGEHAKLIQGILRGDPPGGEEKAPATAWLETVAKTCREQAVRGALVQRLTSRLGAAQVVVEVHFVAEMPDGSFVPVLHFTQSADVSKPRPDVQQQLRNDPQIKQILDLMAAAGLNAAAPQLELALNHGAATQEAKQQADARFAEYQERFLRQLGRPLVPAFEQP